MATLIVEGMCKYYNRQKGKCDNPLLQIPNLNPETPLGPETVSKAFKHRKLGWICSIGGKKGPISGDIAMAQKQCSGYQRGPNRRQEI